MYYLDTAYISILCLYPNMQYLCIIGTHLFLELLQNFTPPTQIQGYLKHSKALRNMDFTELGFLRSLFQVPKPQTPWGKYS